MEQDPEMETHSREPGKKGLDPRLHRHREYAANC